MQFGNPLSSQVGGDSQNLLSTGTIQNVSNGLGALSSYTVTITLTQSYQALLLSWASGAAAPPICAKAQVQGSNAAFSAGFMSQPGAIAMQGIIPFSNAPGDVLVLTIYSFGAAGNNLTYQLWGLLNCPILVRPDGRAYPVGALSTPLTSAAFLGAIPNARYLLKQAAMAWASTGATIFSCSGLVNTGNTGFATSSGGSAGSSITIAESGMLCDPNTGITGSTIGAAITQNGSTLLYDVVPA